MSSQPEHLADLLLDTIERRASHLALVHGDVRWTYAELGEHVHDIRQRIARSGFRRGERVLLWLENSPRFVAAWIAVLALRGVAVPLHAQTPIAEVLRLLRNVSATGLVVSGATWMSSAGQILIENGCSQTGLAAETEMRESVADHLRFVLRADGVDEGRFHGEVERASENLAQIIHTSGSTGQPKGVMLSHANLIANARAVCASLALTQDDAVMAVLPFAFSYGNSVLLTHLLTGGCVVIENTPYPQSIVERMQAEEVTSLAGVTSTFAMLLRQSADAPPVLPDLRTLTHAGGPLPAALLARMRTAFPRQRIFLMYGQTEASPRLTCLPPEELNRKPTSVGRAIQGVSLGIARADGRPAAAGELGEVLASGENIMQGYWGDPAATAATLRDGWLHTGDLGRLDDEGYLTLAGRNDEMIKSGDYRVGPAEVEAVLLDHPQVREAAVVGIDDAVLGQALCAVVILAPDASVGERELLAYCAKRLPPYKRPRQIRLIDSLPRTLSGKILRQRLRDIACASSNTNAVMQK